MRKKDRTGNLYGMNVFVTGASSGIGQACAIAFAKNGCAVTGVSRNTEEKAESFPGGGSLTLRRLDVTDETAVREFIEKLPGTYDTSLNLVWGFLGAVLTVYLSQIILQYNNIFDSHNKSKKLFQKYILPEK